jgi:hypothetical protein
MFGRSFQERDSVNAVAGRSRDRTIRASPLRADDPAIRIESAQNLKESGHKSGLVASAVVLLGRFADNHSRIFRPKILEEASDEAFYPLPVCPDPHRPVCRAVDG